METLVLGGGGAVGIAWELGVLAGLDHAGVALPDDRIVGTSAGAIVGAQIASGTSPAELYEERVLVEPDLFKGEGSRRQPDLTPLFAFFMQRPTDASPSPALLKEMGAFARAAETIDETRFLAGVAQFVPTVETWPQRFVCTAVDADSGEFVAWAARDRIDLVRAVASSCAVPGLYPPVTIAGRRFIDGGLRSNTNADLAVGANDVLLLAVTIPAFATPMEAAARLELDRLERNGARTRLIVPDDQAHAAFGPDLMDASRRAVVAKAGFEQGLREAERVGQAFA